MRDMRNAYSILIGNSEGKRPLGRPKCRWEDNIEMHVREIGWEDGQWISLAQDSDQCLDLANTAVDLAEFVD
jgi:hypothetical protein